MQNKRHFFRGKYKPGWPAWLTGAVIILFGLALVIWPNITMGFLLNLLGGVLIAIGVFHIVRYFTSDHRAAMFNFDLGLGITLAFLGLLVILLKGFLLSIVPAILGCILLITGFVKIQAAFDFKRMQVQRWYLEMIAAGISLVLGMLIIFNPFGTGMLLTRMIGVAILIEGIQDIISLRAYNRVYTTYFTDKD